MLAAPQGFSTTDAHGFTQIRVERFGASVPMKINSPLAPADQLGTLSSVCIRVHLWLNITCLLSSDSR
jgi:hypothetical protein